ncbi:TonB-dependent receptor [Gammaproteobacteria bacterium]|nr:TonB-dependent receptor [Gammaproteobacteria bacterium]
MKNLYLLMAFAFIITPFAFADNPGVEDEVVSPVVQEAVPAAEEEEVVTEETTSTTSSDVDDEVVSLEKVIVTGSRIKRTQTEGALPVLVITKEDISNSGFRNVTEALQSIPSANQYTQNESLTNNFTPNANELDLRNLGPGRVLYLINGRRTADYPVPYNNAGNIVNIGTVPSGLVERIEVLSQGASAIYGSDAVSGVVNVITVKGRETSNLEIYASETEHGGDNIVQATFTTGGFFGNSSWTLGIDGTMVDPMYYADREGFDSFVYDADYGTGYVSPRSGLLWYTGADGLGPRAFYGSEEFGIPCSTISPDFFDFDKQDPEFNYTGSYPGHFCGHDYGGDRFGGTSSSIVNEREDLSIMASFTHTFDNGINFDARYYNYHDEAYYRGSVNRYLFMSGGILDPQRIGELTSTSTDPANNIPLASASLTVPYFVREFSANNAPNAESRSDIEEDMSDLFIGLSGTTNQGWEWSVGWNSTEYTYATSDQTFTDKMYDYFAGVGATDADGNLLRGSYNAYTSPYNPADYGYDNYDDFAANFGLGRDPVCGWQNQFGRSSCFLADRLFGEVTNEMLGSWLADDSQLADSNQTTVDFQLSGEFELMNKFVGFAVTAEHQSQNYSLTPAPGRLDDDNDPDAIVFIQGSAINGGGKRERTSLGLELASQVTDKLEVNVASRYDGYDDASSNVGSRRSNMFSFAYRPNDDVLVRGSISESFRAPDMNYLFQEASSGFYNGFQDYVACYAYYVSDPATYNYTDYRDCEVGSGSVKANLSGNSQLEEEEGENFQLGLVWNITENLDFTIDLYEVMLERAVTRESPYTINYAEGKCTYGDAFQEFMRDEFPDRNCEDVYSQIIRGDTTDPISGDLLPIGSFEEVFPRYSNQSYLNYEGADWSMNYRYETLNAGDFYFAVSSSHILKSASKFDDYSDEEDALDVYLYEPRSQQNASVRWVYEDWSVSLFADRTGHMEAYNGTKTDPHIIMNLSTSYRYSPDLSFYLSVRNLEDKMPQKDAAYGFPYYNQNYFSAFGRYITVGGSYTF